MAVAKISILSREDIELVHQESLSILERTGVSVLSDRALDVLEAGGAAVDRDAKRARLPEELVRETLRRIPKEITLCGRDPGRDMHAPRTGPPWMATNGTAVYMTDLATGERRATVGRDLREFMVLCDAMEPLDYVWPIVTAHDAPAEWHALHELAISLESTTKHVQGEAMSGPEARAEIEVASAIVGGHKELARRPIFSVIQCPICPLEFEKGSIEAVMEFASAGIPVVSMSMALCGLTAPVTLAGTMAVVNAENLASFAISEMTRAGAPVVYSSESAAPNMQTGEIHYGSLEEVLLASAAAQMALHYRVPSMVGGFGVGLGSVTPGINIDPAELIFTSMTSMTGTDFASGIGGLDEAKGAALEQVVIDCDLWAVVREMRKDVPLGHDRFAADLIDKVGPGGTFLKEPHTARNMRKELFLPEKGLAELLELYRLNRGQTRLVEKARERAAAVLRTHTPEPLDRDVKARIDDILERHS